MVLPRITVEFVVSGFDCAPEEISDGLGVAPTKTWRRGDLIRAPDIRKKSNGWCLASPLEEHWALEPHLRWLVTHLPSHADVGLGSDGRTADVSCGIEMADRAPSLFVPRDVMERFAQLGADLDIDIIVFPLGDD